MGTRFLISRNCHQMARIATPDSNRPTILTDSSKSVLKTDLNTLITFLSHVN